MAWIVPAATAAYGIISSAIAKGRNQTQIDQQTKLNQLAVNSNEDMAKFGMGLQLQQWKATGPVGQVEQMKEAGLNPALMYSGGGGGGQSMGTVNTPISPAQASSNNDEKGTIIANAGQAISQALMMKSQLHAMDTQADANEATANNQQAQADAITGHQNAQTDATTANITADTSNKQLQQGLLKAQTTAQNIANYINKGSADNQIEQIKEQATLAMNQATSAGVQAGLDQATIDEKKTTIQQQAIASILQNLKTKADTTNVQQQTAASKNQVQVSQEQLHQAAQQIQQTWNQLDTQAKQARIDDMYKRGLLDLGDRELTMQYINAAMSVFSTATKPAANVTNLKINP